MIRNPFEGMADPIGIPKKKKKKMVKITKGDIECDCGALEKFFTAWEAYHDKDCIITKKNKNKRGKRK